MLTDNGRCGELGASAPVSGGSRNSGKFVVEESMKDTRQCQTLLPGTATAEYRSWSNDRHKRQGCHSSASVRAVQKIDRFSFNGFEVTMEL